MRFEIKMKKKRCEFEINKIKINEIQNKENEIQNKNKRKTKRDNKETIKRFARTIGLTCGGVRRKKKEIFFEANPCNGSELRSEPAQKWQRPTHFCNRGVQKEPGCPNVKRLFLENGSVRFYEKITEGSYGHSLGTFFRVF